MLAHHRFSIHEQTLKRNSPLALSPCLSKFPRARCSHCCSSSFLPRLNMHVAGRFSYPVFRNASSNGQDLIPRSIPVDRKTMAEQEPLPTGYCSLKRTGRKHTVPWNAIYLYLARGMHLPTTYHERDHHADMFKPALHDMIKTSS